ncbi:MAG: hypothetical protein M3Y70_00890 [Pseudomonadota bacterium]|nr:hypothetical protein [Pseudomonadota bacterium]
MTLSIRWWLPLSFVLLLPACNASPGDAAPAEVAASPEATAAAPSAVAATDSDPGEGMDYTLSMDDVDAYLATIGNISKAAQLDSELEDVAAMEGEETPEQFAARIEADPDARALVTSAGLEVQEFARIGEALMAGLMTAGAMESGALKTIPDGIDPRHVAFAREHMAQLKAKLAALEADSAD